MVKFSLDPQLAADSQAISRLGLCELRLVNDSRWPWILLVPQRPAIVELFDLTPLDQTLLTFETAMAAEALKAASGAAKVNIAAIGNVVSQFHLHLVARNVDDENWPKPIWGHGSAVAWETGPRQAFVQRLLEAL
ncbi:HIT domain-containing protein [Pseudohoeflea coraliihabitans]|uniref:HIT domain-containing protein n=1 Tax=Pseudohoeflea coraliihabitans TaxID=2860393 RepID=A0ABS6WP74_9HYPH|nr:HIT domain-containing protein [Pseudohoeflea sp. DP4N28-3]MBW3097764.1 HIT domain-containing protein [Pseudohoeflea sp. DP4N28-3]